jgi:hypothetical protein
MPTRSQLSRGPLDHPASATPVIPKQGRLLYRGAHRIP